MSAERMPMSRGVTRLADIPDPDIPDPDIPDPDIPFCHAP